MEHSMTNVLFSRWFCLCFELIASLTSRSQITMLTIRFKLYIAAPNKVTGTTQVTQFYYLTKDKFIRSSNITFGPRLQLTVPFVCKRRGWS